MQPTQANRLYFDLETLPTDIEAVRAHIVADVIAKQPAQNVAKILKETWNSEQSRNLRVSTALEKTAVDPLLARPIVAAFAFDDEPVQTLWLEPFAEAMAELAARFNERIRPNTTWIGFNSNSFDLPILLNVWRRLRLAIPLHFPRWTGRYWRGNTYDAMRRVPNANGLGFVSLDACCEALGLGSAKTVLWGDLAMDGSRVKAAYDAGEKQLLLDYCSVDVEMLRQLVDILTANWTYTDYPPRDDIAEQIALIRAQRDIGQSRIDAEIISLLRASGLVPGL